MPPADNATDAVPLNAKHAPQALELAELTHPGPFGNYKETVVRVISRN